MFLLYHYYRVGGPEVEQNYWTVLLILLGGTVNLVSLRSHRASELTMEVKVRSQKPSPSHKNRKVYTFLAGGRQFFQLYLVHAPYGLLHDEN